MSTLHISSIELAFAAFGSTTQPPFEGFCARAEQATEKLKAVFIVRITPNPLVILSECIRTAPVAVAAA